MPDGREGVIKNQKAISHDSVSGAGDIVVKKTVVKKTKSAFTPINIVQSAFILFLIFYGFFAMTNPQMYPIFGRTMQYSNFDPLIGSIMFIAGMYLLVKLNR